MDIKIENMTLDDLYKIKDVLSTEFDDFWSYNVLEEELKCNTSHFLVAKNENGEIVGFAGLKVIVDEADIMNIVVKKSFRHHGIGSMILERLIDLARTLKLNKITLEVNDHNLSAIRLYDKFNFHHLGIRKKYYNGESDAVIMSKEL